jgi:hypothetical protein
MCALGQKQTSQGISRMSALPPKADMDRSGCEKQTYAPQQIPAYSMTSSAIACLRDVRFTPKSGH